jgi:RNA polymerase sigma-70 factor, ECF subfamily
MHGNGLVNSNEFCCREDVQGTRERALVMAAQAGEPGAIDELLVRHKGAMFRAARRYTNNHEDAEDLVQDAMLRAFVNIRRFRKESRIGTWLVAIVNNAALSMKRRAKLALWFSIDQRKGEEGCKGWDFPDTHRNPEQEVIRQDLLHILNRGISRQSETHQLVMQACLFDEQRTREAARVLGMTAGSMKSHLYRARRSLADSLDKEGFLRRRARRREASVESQAAKIASG